MPVTSPAPGGSARRTVVGGVLLDADGRVLVARRTRPGAIAGRYEFPGGKVEPGEAAESALVRELAEELRVSAVLGAEIGGGPWPIADTHELRLWWARTDDEPVPGDSHDEVRWLPLAEIAEIALLDSDRAALPAILNGYATGFDTLPGRPTALMPRWAAPRSCDPPGAASPSC